MSADLRPSQPGNPLDDFMHGIHYYIEMLQITLEHGPTAVKNVNAIIEKGGELVEEYKKKRTIMEAMIEWKREQREAADALLAWVIKIDQIARNEALPADISDFAKALLTIACNEHPSSALFQPPYLSSYDLVFPKKQTLHMQIPTILCPKRSGGRIPVGVLPNCNPYSNELGYLLAPSEIGDGQPFSHAVLRLPDAPQIVSCVPDRTAEKKVNITIQTGIDLFGKWIDVDTAMLFQSLIAP